MEIEPITCLAVPRRLVCLRGQLLQLTAPYKRSVKLSRGGELSRVPENIKIGPHSCANTLENIPNMIHRGRGNIDFSKLSIGFYQEKK